jgi:hypothetical protein
MTDDKRTDQHDQVDEAAVDAYLNGESAVSAAYLQLNTPEPPAALDRAILKEASEATKAGGVGGRLAGWMPWIKPLSAVAVAVLCVSVVLEVLYPPTLSLQSVDPDVASPALSDAQRSAAKAPASKLQEERVSPDASRDLFSEGVARERNADGPAMYLHSQLEILEQEQAATLQKRREAGPPVAAAVLAEPASPAPEVKDAPERGITFDYYEMLPSLDAEISEDKRAPARSTAPRHKEDRSLLPAHDTWAAGIRYLQAGGELQRAALETRKLQLVYPQLANEPAAAMAEAAAGDIDELDQTFTTTGKMSAEAEDAASDVLLRTVDGVYPAPDVWLAGIEYLGEQGEVDQANLELQKFRQVYPDHPEQQLP